MKITIKKPAHISTTLGVPGPEGPEGPPGVTRISSADDVDASSLNDGSVLVYKTATDKWTSTILLNQQIMDAGEF